MLRYAKAWPERIWAVEGAKRRWSTTGPKRLLEAARALLTYRRSSLPGSACSTPGTTARPTHELDAHSIAVVAARTEGLRVLKVDGELEALRMLTDRREALTRLRVLGILGSVRVHGVTRCVRRGQRRCTRVSGTS